MQKILLKFLSGDPNGGAKYMWVGKICDFRQIIHCISKTVRYKAQMMCGLYNSTISGDLE